MRGRPARTSSDSGRNWERTTWTFACDALLDGGRLDRPVPRGDGRVRGGPTKRDDSGAWMLVPLDRGAADGDEVSVGASAFGAHQSDRVVHGLRPADGNKRDAGNEGGRQRNRGDEDFGSGRYAQPAG